MRMTPEPTFYNFILLCNTLFIFLYQLWHL